MRTVGQCRQYGQCGQLDSGTVRVVRTVGQWESGKFGQCGQWYSEDSGIVRTVGQCGQWGQWDSADSGTVRTVGTVGQCGQWEIGTLRTEFVWLKIRTST